MAFTTSISSNERFKKGLGLLFLLVAVALGLYFLSFPSINLAAAVAGPTTYPVDLLNEWPEFPHGIDVNNRDQEVRTTLGTLFPFGYIPGNPEWHIGQWHGAYPFIPPLLGTTTNGAVEYKTEGKRLVIGPGNRLIMGVNTVDRALHTNTGKKDKTQFGLSRDTWTAGADFYRLTDLASIKLTFKGRLTKAEKGPGGLEGGSAQAFLGFHVRNATTTGAGVDDVMYFVIGLYDARYSVKPETVNIDGASMDQYIIYNTGTEAIAGKGVTFSDKQWHTVDVDLLPIMKRGLTKIWAEADKSGGPDSYASKNFADYTFSQVAAHWEMSENMNVEFEFQDLDVVANVLSDKPILTLTADVDRVLPGGATTVRWNTRNVSNCTITGPNVASSGVSGSFSTGPLASTSVYTLACGAETRQLSVRVSAMGCAITAAPSSVTAGNPVTLSWNTVGTFLSKSIYPGITNEMMSGVNSIVVRPQLTTNYEMTLWNGTRMTPGGERAVFSQCNAVVTVAPGPDVTAPSVSITAPAPNASVAGMTTVTVVASDANGVTSVEFKDGGTSLFLDTTAPYSYNWNTTLVTDGAHTLTAVARDAAGNVATNSIQVQVSNATPPMSSDAAKIKADLEKIDAALRTWGASKAKWWSDASFNLGTNPTIDALIQKYPDLKAILPTAPVPPTGFAAYRYKNNENTFACGGNIQAGVNILSTSNAASVKTELDQLVDGSDGAGCGKVTYNSTLLIYKLSNTTAK